MKTQMIPMVVLAAFWLAGCSEAPAPPAAAAHNTLTKEEMAQGWVLLFDGETLNGWDDPAKKNPPGDAWIIEDGCIKSVRRPRLREDLFTDQSFGDFELAFDWKISPKGNSGVKYRVQDRALLVRGKTKPDAKRFEETVDYELENRLGDRAKVGPDDHFEEYVIGFEYQIIDNKGNSDATHGADRTTGALYSMIAPSRQTAKPVGEFNHSRIVLRGNHVEHWLNGVKVVDADLTSEPIRAGLEKRWTKDSPVYRLLTEMPKKSGPIDLQNHNHEAWFRDIKIRRLD